jgi:hypothetical protein
MYLFYGVWEGGSLEDNWGGIRVDSLLTARISANQRRELGTVILDWEY